MAHGCLPGRVLPKPVLADPSEGITLSAEQIKFFQDNGFLVIKNLIEFDALYSYKQRFIQICKGISVGKITVVKEPSLVQQNVEPEKYINKIQELLYDDVFVTYAEHPKLLSVLSQLIGDDITAVNSLFINKPPGATRHPPHQDIFYFPFRPAEKIVGSWTAIDDVNYENGCLYVIPGSHKVDTLYDHKDKEDALKLYHGVEESLAPLEQRVHLDMSPGDTVFFHSLLVHGSGPNVSKNYRKAITFHFANSSCHYIDVKNTTQELIANQVEAISKKRGFDLNYADLWRLKSRQVKGIRSNL